MGVTMNKETIEMLKVCLPFLNDYEDSYIEKLLNDSTTNSFIIGIIEGCKKLYNEGYRKITPMKSFYDHEKRKHIIDGVEFMEEQIEVLSKFSEFQIYKASEAPKWIINFIDEYKTLLLCNGETKQVCINILSYIKAVIAKKYGIKEEL